MPWSYAGHCEDCCEITKGIHGYLKNDEHVYEADFKYHNRDEVLEVKLSLIKHTMKTQHKNFFIIENYDNDRPFMSDNKYMYTPFHITNRELEDLEYIVTLKEQVRKRDYNKLECLVKEKTQKLTR